MSNDKLCVMAVAILGSDTRLMARKELTSSNAAGDGSLSDIAVASVRAADVAADSAGSKAVG